VCVRVRVRVGVRARVRLRVDGWVCVRAAVCCSMLQRVAV